MPGLNLGRKRVLTEGYVKYQWIISFHPFQNIRPWSYLNDGVGAEVPSFALFAVFSHPYLVKLVHD
jgi:hypothetical protein